jgi:hypothetical protein
VRASDPTFRVEPLLSDADIEQQELSNGAGQLAISQGIHGVGLGLEICALAGCRRDRQWGAVAIATSMLGVGSVILGTRGRLDPRMSIAMRYGNLWGTLGAYSLFGATSRFYDESSSASGNWRALIGALIAGQFGGLALGGLAWRGLRFSEADARTPPSVGACGPPGSRCWSWRR